MNELAIQGDKFHINENGIEFHGLLTRKEWNALGNKVGRVGKSIGFVIGDWFNYGQHQWGGDGSGRVGGMYADAIELTGLDYHTLSSFSNVARQVQFRLRNRNLDFNHHRVVAKLKTPEEQQQWLDAAEKHGLSVRRLRKSINSGRVVSIEEMKPDPADRGQQTYLSWIIRLSQWWRKRTADDPVSAWDDDLKAMLKRDIQPIVDIYNQL